MSIRKILILSLLLIVASAADSSDDHESLVRPFLEQYCYKCHGAEVQKSDRRFDTLTHSGVYRVSILCREFYRTLACPVNESFLTK